MSRTSRPARGRPSAPRRRSRSRCWRACSGTRSRSSLHTRRLEHVRPDQTRPDQGEARARQTGGVAHAALTTRPGFEPRLLRRTGAVRGLPRSVCPVLHRLHRYAALVHVKLEVENVERVRPQRRRRRAALEVVARDARGDVRGRVLQGDRRVAELEHTHVVRTQRRCVPEADARGVLEAPVRRAAHTGLRRLELAERQSALIRISPGFKPPCAWILVVVDVEAERHVATAAADAHADVVRQDHIVDAGRPAGQVLARPEVAVVGAVLRVVAVDHVCSHRGAKEGLVGEATGS